MTNLVDQLRLAERAAEDIYFARIERELIEAQHRMAQLGLSDPEPSKRSHVQAEAIEGPVVGDPAAEEH